MLIFLFAEMSKMTRIFNKYFTYICSMRRSAVTISMFGITTWVNSINIQVFLRLLEDMFHICSSGTRNTWVSLRFTRAVMLNVPNGKLRLCTAILICIKESFPLGGVVNGVTYIPFISQGMGYSIDKALAHTLKHIKSQHQRVNTYV